MVIRRGGRFSKTAHLLKMYCHIAGAASLILLTTEHGRGQDLKARQASISGFLNTAPGVRYVGSKVCVGCHSTIYQNFSRTGMARSTSLPIKVMDLGWLNKPVDIFNEKHNRHYQMFVRGSKVYQSEYELDNQGKEVFRHTEELAYLIGSGVNGDTPVVRRGTFPRTSLCEIWASIFPSRQTGLAAIPAGLNLSWAGKRFTGTLR
jgi:hypothetical protein